MKKIYTTEEDIRIFRKEMEEDKNTKYRSFKKYIGKTKNILFGVVVILLTSILLMVNAVKSEGKAPVIFGYSLYQVETGSMEPTLPIGSIILTSEVKNKENLEIGDVVTFKWDDNVVTHRIVEVVNDNGQVKYKTKGDNKNNSIDPNLLHPSDIIAKFVCKLPFTG